MKKSANVLLSAVFLTTIASFRADKVHAQQNLSNAPEASSLQMNNSDSSSHHNSTSGRSAHRGFFGRLFHRSPTPVSNQNTVNDGPRRNETPLKTDAAVVKNSGGFGSTGNGSAHS